MFEQPSGYERATGTRVIHQGPCSFVGLLAVATAAGDTVAIYDGIDAASGRLVHTFTAGGAGTQQLPLFPGVHFDRGIVTVGSAGMTEYTVLYTPDAADPPSDSMMKKPAVY